MELEPAQFAAWRLLGYLRLNASDYAGSVAASETALDLKPDDPAAHANLSWAFAALGDRARAEYHALRVEQLAPGSADALALRAELEQRAGHANPALELYRAAAQRAANDATLQIRYAAALRSAGQGTQARDWLRAALKNQPESFRLRIALADVLFELADYAAAAREAELALEREPTAPAALYIAGAAAYQLQNHLRAADRLGRYLQTDVSALEVRLLYANALLHAERTDEAARQYGVILAASPNRADARYNLGVALWKSDRREEARALFRALCSEGDAAACPYAEATPRQDASPAFTDPAN